MSQHRSAKVAAILAIPIPFLQNNLRQVALQASCSKTEFPCRNFRRYSLQLSARETARFEKVPFGFMKSLARGHGCFTSIATHSTLSIASHPKRVTLETVNNAHSSSKLLSTESNSATRKVMSNVMFIRRHR